MRPLCPAVCSVAAMLPLLLSLESGTVYVKSLYVGSLLDDEREGFFGKIEDQLDDICRHEIANDEKLMSAPDGLSAIGFSQGCLLMRALI